MFPFSEERQLKRRIGRLGVARLVNRAISGTWGVAEGKRNKNPIVSHRRTRDNLQERSKKKSERNVADENEVRVQMMVTKRNLCRTAHVVTGLIDLSSTTSARHRRRQRRERFFRFEHGSWRPIRHRPSRLATSSTSYRRRELPPSIPRTMPSSTSSSLASEQTFLTLALAPRISSSSIPTKHSPTSTTSARRNMKTVATRTRACR